MKNTQQQQQQKKSKQTGEATKTCVAHVRLAFLGRYIEIDLGLYKWQVFFSTLVYCKSHSHLISILISSGGICDAHSPV